MTTLLTPPSPDAPPDASAVAGSGAAAEPAPPASVPTVGSASPGRAVATTGRRRRSRRRRARRHSAYEVIVVGLVAYALAALLNARGLDRRAEEGELGPRRDVLTSLTGALADIAHWTALDRPGAAVDAARGRSGSATEPDAPSSSAAAAGSVGAMFPSVATAPASTPAPPIAPESTAAPSTAAPADELAALAAPPAPTATSAAPTTTIPAPTTTASPYVAVRMPTPDDPLRVWVGGDSLAQGLGWSFSRLGAATGLVATTEGGRISSSLARPDYFDWPGEIARVVAEEAPEVVVVMFGANDPQPMASDNGRLAFGTPEWQDEYRARVRTVMALGSEGRRLVWVGEPIVRDGALDERMQIIDAIQREEAAQFPNVTFVDGRTLFTGADGGYADRLPAIDGGEVAVRGGDGVHPNAAGYDRLAAAAAWEILRLTDPAQAAVPAPPATPGAPPPPITG